jgi:hypothetical protein
VNPVQSISETDIMPASYANTSYANIICQLMPTVTSLEKATICFENISGKLLAYDTYVMQLNVPALFGLLLMRVANADVLVSSMQLRSLTWSADLREHGVHLYVKEKQDTVTSNYLEAGVPDSVNLSDKPVMNDDNTTRSAQNRPQKVANVI